MARLQEHALPLLVNDAALVNESTDMPPAARTSMFPAQEQNATEKQYSPFEPIYTNRPKPSTQPSFGM
jgi:hypothetical protein